MTSRQIVTHAVGKCFGFAAQHHFTDRIMNMRSPIWHPKFPWQRISAAEGAQIAEDLNRDGVAIFPNFFDAAAIGRIRAELDKIVEDLGNPAKAKLKLHADEQFYASLQALSLCADFALGAIDPDLLNIVGMYFRRGPFLSETDFRRVIPFDMNELSEMNDKFASGYTSSHWHHDLRGRQVKIQVYLTDVGPGDQNFAFVRGSHRGFKSCSLIKSRFTDAQIERPGSDIVEVYGPAGTAAIFDSNGIHRLRRGRSAVRETVSYYYHPAQMYRATPQKIHPDALRANRKLFASLTSLAPNDGDVV